QHESAFHGSQQRVVVVGGVVHDVSPVAAEMISDDDGGNVAPARVSTAATARGHAEVVLVPSDHDGVVAFLPHLRGHDLADGGRDGRGAGRNQCVRVGAWTGAVHVVALVGHDQ